MIRSRPHRKIGLLVAGGWGTPSRGGVTGWMEDVRRALTADLLERARRVNVFDDVVLLAGDPEWLRSSAPLADHVQMVDCGEPLQAALVTAVRRGGYDAVLMMGGAACPLARDEDFRTWADFCRRERHAFLTNNPLSPDIVAVHPANALAETAVFTRDNRLSLELRAIGLRRVLMPDIPRLRFDVDTPTDVAVLALQGAPGPRTRAMLASYPESVERLRRALDVLREPGREIFLAGRVGTTPVNLLNRNLSLRVRVFSEERGMKALGRLDSGSVVSLLACMLQEIGPERFFAYLADTVHVAFIDTRPLFAHGGRRVDREDRLLSDLGRWRDIREPWVRRFTRAAESASIPVILGGHSLVSGGLGMLVEGLQKEPDPEPRRGGTQAP